MATEQIRLFSKRTGKFWINSKLVYSPLMIQVLTRLQFVPFYVQHVSYRDAYEFVGRSPFFEEIVEGSVVPIYRFEMHMESKNVVGEIRIIPVDNYGLTDSSREVVSI